MKKPLLLLAVAMGFYGISTAQLTAPEITETGIPTNILNYSPKGVKYVERTASGTNLRMSHTDAVVLAIGTSSFGTSSFIDFYTDTTMAVSFNGQIFSTGFSGVGCHFNPYHDFFDTAVPRGNAYRLDTVWVGGIYERIVDNAVGDTLKVEISFGPQTATGNGTSGQPWVSLTFNATAPPALAGRSVFGMIWNKSPNHGFGGSLSAASVTVDYILTTADTVSDPNVNPYYPYIPIVLPNGGLNIPADNFVGVIARYRTGNPSTPGDVYWSNDTAVAVHNSFRPIASVESATPAAHLFFFDSTGLSHTLTRTVRYPGTTSFWTSPRTDRGYWLDFSINADLSGPGSSVQAIDAKTARIGNVYPNPVNAGNTLVLPIEMNRNAAVSYSISNYMGQMISQHDAGTLLEGANRLEIGTETLRPGIYFLNVNIEGAQQAVRFVVNK